MIRSPAFASIPVLVLAVAFAAQHSPDTAGYEIRGTVVDHLSNRPIPRALVRLTPITGPGQLTSLTGEDGRFGFTNIPKGKYRLLAQRRGRTSHAFHETGQYSTAIVVGPGLDATNIVFPLRAPAAISGLVLDEDGDPVQSTSVLIFREMVVEGERRIMQTANQQTNAAGQFRAGQLAAGTYYVAVQGDAFSGFGPGPNDETNLVYPLTYYGNTGDAHAASPISVNEGETAEIQVALHPVPNIHVPVPGSGPRDGPNVQLLLRGLGGTLIGINAMNTFENGSKREMSGFPAGRYLVRTFSNTQGRLASEALMEVELSDGVPLTFPEQNKGTTVSGTVSFETGSRPAQLSVVLTQWGNENQIVTPLQADGTFDSTDPEIVPGRYSIQFNNNDFFIKSVVAKGATIKGDRIEVAENSPVKLSIVAAPSGTLSNLDGFALRDHTAVAGAMVLLLPHDLNRSLLFRRDQSDSDGSFALSNIVPGQYTLVAIDDDGRDLVYKEPAVIQPYLTAGQSITFPRQSQDPVKITVQPRGH